MTYRDQTLAALCDAFVPGDGDLPIPTHRSVMALARRTASRMVAGS